MNSPSSVTLSGEGGPLEEVAARLEERGAFCRFLRVRYAFHSAQMDPIRDELLAALDGIRPRPATLPLFSTVTGRSIEGPELGPEYWWDNVRRTVRFADGVERLIELGCDTAIELSAHPVLAAAVTECYRHHGKDAIVLPSLRRHEDERATMLHSLGALYALGHPIDWGGLMPEPRRFIRLPLYPWQRERFWHEADESRVSRLTAPAHPLLGVAQGGPRPAWEARLDLRLAPYLADHRVQHAAIMPAAAYLELAFAAGREAFGAIGCELRDVKLANPCFLAAEKPLRLQTSFDPDPGTVHVHTRPVQGDREWTVHFTAALHPRTGEAGRRRVLARRDPSTLPARVLPRSVLRLPGGDRPGLRPDVPGHRTGLAGGPGIARAGPASRMLSKRIATSTFSFPALLDACLQAVIPADGDFDQRNGGLYLPHEIEAVRLFRRPGHRVWVHARLLEKTPHRSVSDVDIYDEDGAARGAGARPAQPSRRGRPGGVARRPALCLSVAPPAAIGGGYRAGTGKLA